MHAKRMKIIDLVTVLTTLHHLAPSCTRSTCYNSSKSTSINLKAHLHNSSHKDKLRR